MQEIPTDSLEMTPRLQQPIRALGCSLETHHRQVNNARSAEHVRLVSEVSEDTKAADRSSTFSPVELHNPSSSHPPLDPVYFSVVRIHVSGEIQRECL